MMKLAGVYFLGYVVLAVGIVAALWKSGVLDRVGTGWTLIGLVIALGIGIMIAVANRGPKGSIQIDPAPPPA